VKRGPAEDIVSGNFMRTARLTFASVGTPFQVLTGFETSGFLDLRFFPDVSKHIDFVPLRTSQHKLLDCPVRLHGLDGRP
jgi:hypothetical protein